MYTVLHISYISIKLGKVFICEEKKNKKNPGSLTTSTRATWHLKAMPKSVDSRARDPGKEYRITGE